jgi:hypothetical protein
MNLLYLLPRLVRHFMPAALVRFLLRQRWIIKPGMETSNPEKAVERYLANFQTLGFSIQGKSILILGYGGRFAVGCGLLEKGAGRILLCEYEAPADDQANRSLLERFPDLLEERKGAILPKGDRLQLYNGDIRQMASQLPRVDLVLSSSVFEHLADVDGITQALANLTAPGGLNLHYIDLRDHFFRYPFEMLRYSEQTWQKWLNPTSNLNRLRAWNYQQIFEKYFQTVAMDVISSNTEMFLKVRDQIRPEFLSGDGQLDSAGVIRLTAHH